MLTFGPGGPGGPGLPWLQSHSSFSSGASRFMGHWGEKGKLQLEAHPILKFEKVYNWHWWKLTLSSSYRHGKSIKKRNQFRDVTILVIESPKVWPDYHCKYHLPQKKSRMRFLFHFALDHNTASVFGFPTVNILKRWSEILNNLALCKCIFTSDIL